MIVTNVYQILMAYKEDALDVRYILVFYILP